MAIAEAGPSPPEPEPEPETEPRPTCVVTFGQSSPLGRSLAAALAASGRWSTVAVLDPGPPPAASGPVAHFAGDLSDATFVAAALAGAGAVFHVDPTTSSLAAGQGDFLALHRLAVEGTRRLLVACSEGGVRRVVYTGSADVVFDGARDVVDADEAMPYPDKFWNALNDLRAQVEMIVLGADGKNGMRTCALRPSNPFGPGVSSLVRFISGYVQSPFSKFVIGSGHNMCDFTYVENVAHANICAEQALCSNLASVAGKPFFVTNDEPIEMWEFISSIIEAMGCQRPRFNLPAKILLLTAMFSKVIHQKLGLQTFSTPLLDPDTICLLSCTRTFNCSKAKSLLGYSPTISLEDGLTRTIQSFPELSNNLGLSRKQNACGPLKADQLLGCGIAADILLWRDEKKTFSYVTILFLLFYWFLLSDRTFISSAAKILLVISMALFIHGALPPSIFGFTIGKMTSTHFEVSRSTMRSWFMCLASLWNKGIHILKLLAKGDDWNILFKCRGRHSKMPISLIKKSLQHREIQHYSKGEGITNLVVAWLYFIKMMFHLPVTKLIGIGLACSFFVFIVYEQCEEEIDRFVAIASAKIKTLKDRVLAKLPASLKVYISPKASSHNH